MTPKVTLVNYTSDALNMLIFAKSTRLEMRPSLYEEIKAMSEEEKLKEVDYIANTIPSSWEFVDFTFLIEDVTRAFTHQLVRTRTASYAQQAMRIADMSKGFKYSTGPTIDDPLALSFPSNREIYDGAMEHIREAYEMLVKNGVAVQDARGLLPTNIGTNIMAKMNLRTLVDVCRKRSSSRVQDEYREVVRQMKALALEALPWTQHFIDRTFDKAAAELDEIINQLADWNKQNTNQAISADIKMKMIKLLDQMRMQS